jgi:hypothetical protein
MSPSPEPVPLRGESPVSHESAVVTDHGQFMKGSVNTTNLNDPPAAPAVIVSVNCPFGAERYLRRSADADFDSLPALYYDV